MIAGATISVLPMRDFFIAGWVLIAWGCVRELKAAQAAVVVLVFGTILTVFYREVPKPPTTDQLAEAIATRIVVLQSGGRVQLLVPPTGLRATAKTSPQAAAVAQKVLQLVVKKRH